MVNSLLHACHQTERAKSFVSSKLWRHSVTISFTGGNNLNNLLPSLNSTILSKGSSIKKHILISAEVSLYGTVQQNLELSLMSFKSNKVDTSTYHVTNEPSISVKQEGVKTLLKMRILSYTNTTYT